LIKTACQHLLLLIGFDILIYQKYYDTPPILVGHQAPEKSLISMNTSILVDSVGPPSADVCRIAASFPQVYHPKFIELREEEVKDIPLKQPCN
jgi:hypothetical protein